MPFKVTLFSTSDTFKGFLIQARSALNSSEAIGQWSTSVPKTKSLDCFNVANVYIQFLKKLFALRFLNFYFIKSAVTHSLGGHNSHHFRNITLTWFHPKMTSLGDFYIM